MTLLHLWHRPLTCLVAASLLAAPRVAGWASSPPQRPGGSTSQGKCTTTLTSTTSVPTRRPPAVSEGRWFRGAFHSSGSNPHELTSLQRLRYDWVAAADLRSKRPAAGRAQPPILLPLDKQMQAHELWGSLDDQGLAHQLEQVDTLLAQGSRLPLRGGNIKSQNAHRQGPVTWIRASELSKTSLLRGMRAGHMFMTRHPLGPCVELTATSDRSIPTQGQGGDTLIVERLATFHVRVTGGQGKLLRVIMARGVEQAFPIDHARWEQSFTSGETCFVRVEVTDRSGSHYHALSNPIYLETP